MRADKAKVTRMLKTARGQLDGLLRMVEEDRYCIDIANQLLATEALLRSTNRIVMRGHIEGCIRDACENGDIDQKLDELMNTLDRMNRT
jgi:DNA-binding FrmR family transcriptional regulator